MKFYTLNLSDEQVTYFQNLDCEKLVEDIQAISDLLDQLDFESDVNPLEVECDEFCDEFEC